MGNYRTSPATLHSIACHPTQVNAPRLIPSLYAGTRFTYPGGLSLRCGVDCPAPLWNLEPGNYLPGGMEG